MYTDTQTNRQIDTYTHTLLNVQVWYMILTCFISGSTPNSKDGKECIMNVTSTSSEELGHYENKQS